jgi:hypothetical protein
MFDETEGRGRLALPLLRFRCTSCGYGASCRRAPERCPMCGENAWVDEGWRLFTDLERESDADAPLVRERAPQLDPEPTV